MKICLIGDFSENYDEGLKNRRIKEEGRKARKFVEKYSWDNIVDEFEGILEEIVDSSGEMNDRY